MTKYHYCGIISTPKGERPKRTKGKKKMTNAHHKFVVYATLKVENDDGTWYEKTFNRYCNNEKTRDQTLRRWAREFKNGTFLYGRRFEVVREPWFELR